MRINDKINTEYIAAIMQNDYHLLSEMYDRFFPMIRKLIQINGGTKQDAEDVFQDAVIVIYMKAQKTDFKLTCQFSTFLYSVSFIIWRNRRLGKPGMELPVLPKELERVIEIPNTDFTEIERQNLFDKAFLQLRENCQRLLRLFFDGFPMSEIARQMGFGGEIYARRRKHACKEKLIMLVKRQPGYIELIND